MTDRIDYQGDEFKLTKSYEDYDAYKNDPNNLDPLEAARVERLVKSAPIAKRFENCDKMIEAVYELKFPGYGLTSRGHAPQDDGSELALWSIEIPQSGNHRYLVFSGKGGKNNAFDLVDDFVHPDKNRITSVTAEGDKLVYLTFDGERIEHLPSKS